MEYLNFDREERVGETSFLPSCISQNSLAKTILTSVLGSRRAKKHVPRNGYSFESIDDFVDCWKNHKMLFQHKKMNVFGFASTFSSKIRSVLPKASITANPAKIQRVFPYRSFTKST